MTQAMRLNPPLLKPSPVLLRRRDCCKMLLEFVRIVTVTKHPVLSHGYFKHKVSRKLRTYECESAVR